MPRGSDPPLAAANKLPQLHFVKGTGHSPVPFLLWLWKVSNLGLLTNSHCSGTRCQLGLGVHADRYTYGRHQSVARSAPSSQALQCTLAIDLPDRLSDRSCVAIRIAGVRWVRWF